ncbi:GerMN domain-containing protein [Acetatifactor muris]|uniref:Sporulation and spore germination n=1 Tax=Acetatifactor muris TaxID=879566 RepID=A0A2K4ZFV9_9FIRM|nr:GerMN domain-containing protein [Acetatifactor muris]MCR2047643.1 GerMN domain-containing protein [Acetatifactor muris]SOY29351.1 Sporulation and spore germination [Acetatifactor muris]
MVRKICVVMMLFAGLILMSACGENDEKRGNIYQVYCVSNSETRVEVHDYEMTAAEPEEQLMELMNCLSTNPEKLEYKVPFAMGFQVLDMELKEGNLLINVDAAYKELPVYTEVLVRAAIVRTLTQLPEVRLIMLTVEGEQLSDNKGNAVGWMNAEQFIDNDGNEINTYEMARVKLYFADENGTNLIAAYREKHYSTNTLLERFVVEELIAGPSGQVDGLYPCVNPNTKVINVTTKDGICYVNLDENFLTVVNNVSTDVSVYAITNSLVELSNINKVQILVNGEVPSQFSTSTFERNLDIVTTREQ